MKQPTLSFRVIGESGPLALYWSEGPFGDAIESKEGNGVVWISSSGELLAAEFDDVRKDKDHQILTAPNGIVVEVDIKNGRIKYELRKKTFLHSHSRPQRNKSHSRNIAH